MAGTDKSELRERLLAARRARTAEQIEAARADIRARVLERIDSLQVTCVAAYEPLRTEPGSVQLLAELHARGLHVMVPLTLPDRDLDWTGWPAADDDRRRLGTAAVAEADVVLVPALAVASDGTRLGRGGGSYDRALARVRPDALVAALIYADEVCEELPSEPWDIPVGWAVTPSGWHQLGRKDH